MSATASTRRTRARRGAREAEHAAARVEESTAFGVVARCGIASRVVIYLVLAALTAQVAAIGHSSSPTDADGAFAEIGRQPGGTGFLALLAVTLVAYAVWRLLQSVSGQGGASEPWVRVGATLAGLLYLALCVEVVELLVDGHEGSQHTTSIATQVLRWPAGAELLGLLGVGVGIGAVGLAAYGVVRDYTRVLDPRRVSRPVLASARVLGAMGDLARGGALGLAAFALVDAAVDDRGSAAKSLGLQLQGLSRNLPGEVAICAIAAGFCAFALYSVLELAHRPV